MIKITITSTISIAIAIMMMIMIMMMMIMMVMMIFESRLQGTKGCLIRNLRGRKSEPSPEF